MKKIHRVVALLLSALMVIGLMATAFAATDSAPTIDPGKKASLNIYKYDITMASKDGAWDAESYVSTGLHDDAVIDKLAKYAVQGVEFTYLRVADIAMNNEVVDGQRQVGVLYGFDGADAVLSAIGVTAADAHKSENGKNYYTSDLLNNKLSAALSANATTVKNALETDVKSGVAMTETGADGHTSAENLEQGLYLVVETRVPENVTSTCNPFFVSLPMTTIDGAAWNYDVTVYPKNQTGNPTLDKTVREAKNSTGKNTGSLTDIKDGYEHTATASVGDTVDYQIISTLPTITSKASSLSEYTYVDTLSKGIRYNKNDVVIEFFKDAGCTDKITTWDETSGKFAVAYDDAANTMTIRMTDTGLSEINEATTVYTDSVKCGYSDCTIRISYAATLTADAKMGDTDNPNEVVLTWRRTNNTYFDTLKDCCHVYTYGVDVLKRFSDNGGNMKNVKFRLHNDTDDCYIIADLKDGIYYAKGITSKKSDATTFIPNSSGHIVVKGLEDDTYSLTEIATDKGYVLLKDAVKIVIKTAENGILFLDEIGDLPKDVQTMLLKAIEEHIFYPMGSDTPIKCNFQLICGTNQDLNNPDKFRYDLLQRINRWSYRIPGLSERREDIEPNFNYELELFRRSTKRGVLITEDAREAFMKYALARSTAWDGNFRELRNMVTRMGTLAKSGEIQVADVEREIKRVQAAGKTSLHQEKAEPDSPESVPEDEYLKLLLGSGYSGRYDAIELSTLKYVLDVCKFCSSAAEAGRKIYNVTRGNRATPNDSDRIAKYLKTYSLKFSDLRHA